jgi:hypothetical protein
MGAKKQVTYGRVFESSSKEALVESLVERETREIMYLPLPGLLMKMREHLGFDDLKSDNEENLYYFSLVRNCLLHNGGKADAALRKLNASIENGQRIEVDDNAITSAVNAFRTFSYEVDKRFEALQAKR